MIKKFDRIIILIMDSVGCGYQKDYKKFQNKKSNTLKSIYNSNKNFNLPNLEKLGLNKILFNSSLRGRAVAGKMQEKTLGNDTFAGVWEMLGVIFTERFRSDKTGFSKKTIRKIEKYLGIKMLCNQYISGFEALENFFDLHIKYSSPILYLADDGVVLLAAHEKIISPIVLNKIAEKMVDILRDQNISRIITRPFLGNKGNLQRTDNRKDFIITKNIFDDSILSRLYNNNIKLLTSEHIFHLLGSHSFVDCVTGNFNNNKLIEVIIDKIKSKKQEGLLIFCLQDFDMLGHKKDIRNYSIKLQEFDSQIPDILKELRQDDLLIITADHGCDPALDIRGHTREYVPLLIFNKKNRKKIWLGTRDTFADIAQTICYNYSLPLLNRGKPIYEIF